MSEELKEIPQPGSVFRFDPWNGVVLDVFKSDTSDQHILQIMFAKNIYKQQSAELHVYKDLRSGLLLPPTREALSEELARLNEAALVEAIKLLEKAISPISPGLLHPIPVRRLLMPVHTSDIETRLQKIVSMTEIVCTTERYTVNREDILSELATYVEKYSASCDSARFVADIVHVLKEQADHMN